MNSKRLLWANDFPHSDSTWPWSQDMIDRHTQGVPREVRDQAMGLNCIELFNLPIPIPGAAQVRASA